MLVYVRRAVAPRVREVRANSLGIGIGGVGGNKGATGVRFEIDGSTFCLVNAHLAAGQEHYIERCQHFGTIMDGLRFPDPMVAFHETEYPTPAPAPVPTR